MNCKKCGQEVMNKAVICPSCGCKIKKPIYKKWWFWIIVAVIVISIGGAAGSGDNSGSSSKATTSTITTTESKSEASQIVYEPVDLRTMVDDLNNNALKAEKTYQNKYVEVTGVIADFDSDGSYITIEPVNKDAFDFTNIMCKIKNKEQEEILLNKSKGDEVKIKGKIISIGEFLGYTINIAEIE